MKADFKEWKENNNLKDFNLMGKGYKTAIVNQFAEDYAEKEAIEFYLHMSVLNDESELPIIQKRYKKYKDES